MVRKSLLACALALSISVGVVHAEPEVFSKADFATDRTTAVENDRLHVLYFTASWCPPCQQMKKTTWVDESLVSWLGEHAVVSAIDVDEQQELAKEFRIRAMPTIVVMRGGKELARTVGYQGAVEFKDWFERAEAGLVSSPAKAFAKPAADEAVDVQAKYEEARELVSAGSPDEATQAYLWLWDNMLLHDPSYLGVRVSFMATDMQELAEEHAPSMEAFRAIRDREQALLESGDVSWDRLGDWVVLNKIIGDEDSTIAWIERNAIERDTPQVVRRLENRVKPLLIERGRYDLLARIFDPVLAARTQLQRNDFAESMLRSRVSDIPDEIMASVLKRQAEEVRQEIGVWFAVALVAEKHDAAREVASILFERDNSPESRRALADAAREAGVEMIELPE